MSRFVSVNPVSKPDSIFQTLKATLLLVILNLAAVSMKSYTLIESPLDQTFSKGTSYLQYIELNTLELNTNELNTNELNTF